jgi:hypothetical protein
VREIASYLAVQIFIGTLPMMFVLIWNLIEVKTLSKKVYELAERVAKIEGKIEGRHVVVE